jgi:membrane protease YdiL (CAAX protease family)
MYRFGVIKNWFYKINTKLLAAHPGILVAWVVIINIANSLFFTYVLRTPGGFSAGTVHIFSVLIIAPILETFIFQYLVIKLVEWLKWGNLPAVLISAVLFGLLHFYNPGYIVFAFIGGLVLSYFFVLLRQGKHKAFLWVCIAHILSNLCVVLIAFILYRLDSHHQPLHWDWNIWGF